MSRASEWAAAVAVAAIDHEVDRMLRPEPFMIDGFSAASVGMRYGVSGARVEIHAETLSADDALKLAAWINETFGNKPND
jgi:hypothetical protein